MKKWSLQVKISRNSNIKLRMERKVSGNSFRKFLWSSRYPPFFCKFGNSGTIQFHSAFPRARKHGNADSTKVQDGGVTIVESVYRAFFSRHVCVYCSENVTPSIDKSKPKLNDLTPHVHMYVITQVKRFRSFGRAEYNDEPVLPLILPLCD